MAYQSNTSNNSNTNKQDSIQSQIDQAANQLTQSQADNSNNTPSSSTSDTSFNVQASNVSSNQSSTTSYFSKPDKPITAPTPTLTDQELQHIQEKPQLKTDDKKPKTSSQATVYATAILLCIGIVAGIILLATLIL